MNQSNERNRSQPFLSAQQQAELGVLSPRPRCDCPCVTQGLCELGRAALARSDDSLDTNSRLWDGPKQGKKTL